MSSKAIDANLIDNEHSPNNYQFSPSEVPLQNISLSTASDTSLVVNNPYDNNKQSPPAPSQANPIAVPEKPKEPLGSVDSKTFNYYDKGTLDEPVVETLKRDLFRIGRKMYSVLNPFSDVKDRPKLILQWDLWGPLMFTIILACTLSIHNKEKGEMFVLVFLIFWFCSFLIYLNGNLLGAKLGMFHVMCLIGYCMVPLNFCSILFALGSFYEIIRIIIVLFCCVWSSYSSIGFVKACVPEDKRALLIYPVILEYLFLSGVILMTRPQKA